MDLSELEDNMGWLEWEDRYRYLIELGEALEPIDEVARCEANRVQGCMSQVWLQLEPSEGRLHFRGDSDSAIVKGLVAVLRIAYSGQSPQQILDFDLKGAFSRMGLDEHLSPNRRNGFYSMVGLIRGRAQGMLQRV
ncbi:MAG: cysteine desulfuration protein SufE [Myxococcales bacterium]|nr:cysteine desulfuration protein SufE [Myxococcales bacterium]|tara:strand:+ start:25 stop:432 length:408 start_codon:yes stop_codon:yes gene_type:complete